VVKPEREREPRRWRIAAETQVDRFNKALSALKHAFLALRQTCEVSQLRSRWPLKLDTYVPPSVASPL
jgi:hypothetical protein